jgi:DNA-binding CsgD family transcriptional regulator
MLAERGREGSQPFVGRLVEVADISARLEQARLSRSDVLLIRGEPGIGKTRLLRCASETAAATGARVVSITGAEAEGAIALAGLATLVAQRDGVVATPELTSLLSGERPASPLTLGMAVLNSLSETASLTQTVLVVDDAQWIDEPSVQALVFALRRLADEPLLAIIGVRAGVASGFDNVGFDEVRLEAIETSDLQMLAPADMLASVGERCSYLSGGNPMAFLEIVGALSPEQRAGRVPIDETVWENRKLADWVGRRIAGVSSQTLEALSVIAAVDTESSAPIQAALKLLGRTTNDLLGSEGTGLVRLEPGSIRLVHPLYRTAIAAALGADGMRRAHRAVAQAYGEDPRSAWHWAAAAVGPDEDAAIGLERLAERSISMGAPTMAAEAYDKASQLTADSAQRFRRRLLAGQNWWEASDARRAIEHLTVALNSTSDPSSRADVAGVLGDAIGWYRSAHQGVELQQDAARAVGAIDPGRAAFLELRAALLLGLAGDCTRAYDAAKRAVDFATADGGLTVIATHAVRALAAQMMGDRETASGDLALIMPFTDLPPEAHTIELQLFLQVVSYTLMLREEHDQVESLLNGVLISARQMGLEGVLGFTAGLVSEVAFRRGRFVDAVFLAQPDVNLHKQRDLGAASPGQAALTRACAALGRFDEAFEYGQQAITNAHTPHLSGLEAWATAGIGLAYLGQGDIDRATHTLTSVARLAQDFREPSFMWFESDLADALLQSGKTREALSLASSLEARCATSGTIFGTAVSARIRGIHTANRRLVETSRAAFLTIGAPFEAARSSLALAEHFGDELAAVESAQTFERLGAAPFAERAWRSSANASTRPHLELPTAGLTAAEIRVAACVALGRSNKEAASELSLSARTVDAHLQAIYRKLNINRRTELVLLFSASGNS